MDLNNKYCVGLGEVLFDMLPTGPQLGGAPANFAYHAGQQGLLSVAVSAIGDDELGAEALRLLGEKKLKYVLPVVDYPTGTVQVMLDRDGVPAYDIKRNVAWDNIPLTDEIREIALSTGAVCWGSLAQRNEVTRNMIYRFLDYCPADCLKVFDINLRQNFYDKDSIRESVRRCNILKINDEELDIMGRMYGYADIDMENKCWLILGKYNLDMLILTCGVNGSYVFRPGHMSFLETPKVQVVDTVGAGDSFTATFCTSMLKGRSIEEAHRRAVEVSAYVCTQSGAMPAIPEALLL